ncbi:MAG: BON domain-containing protein, partial [Vicinamibacteraceae bacterium]
MAGVKAVVNDIVVEIPQGQRRDDRDLAEAVDARRITAHVQGSRVVLRGTARSWAARNEAERIGWTEAGVSEVDNQILIGVATP